MRNKIAACTANNITLINLQTEIKIYTNTFNISIEKLVTGLFNFSISYQFALETSIVHAYRGRDGTYGYLRITSCSRREYRAERTGKYQPI